MKTIMKAEIATEMNRSRSHMPHPDLANPSLGGAQEPAGPRRASETAEATPREGSFSVLKAIADSIVYRSSCLGFGCHHHNPESLPLSGFAHDKVKYGVG